MKKVSIIMPYYKKSSFFEKAYHSVLNQNYLNIEIIIIYDDYDLTELSFVKETINNRDMMDDIRDFFYLSESFRVCKTC